MGMIDYFRTIGDSIGFFLGSPKMAKGFKIPVITSYLNVSWT